MPGRTAGTNQANGSPYIFLQEMRDGENFPIFKMFGSKTLLMTLEEKGPIMPPPVLGNFPQQVLKAVQSWEDITAATHWNLYKRTEPDGADFYIGKEELGHIHLEGEVHLAIGEALASLLIKHKLGNKFSYGNDWVTTPIDAAQDVAHATWLFKLSYNRIKGVPVEKLVEEIKTYNSLPE